MEFITSPNFRRGRTVPIDTLVIHYTASLSMEGTIAWFKNPDAQVSAHYVIGRDGRIVQMVNDNDVAWHAGASKLYGRIGVNAFSIGIELVGTADSGFTDSQLRELYTQIALIVTRYQVQSDHVVGHKFISPGRKIDPDGYHNQFNWAKARQVAQDALNHA